MEILVSFTPQTKELIQGLIDRLEALCNQNPAPAKKAPTKKKTTKKEEKEAAQKLEALHREAVVELKKIFEAQGKEAAEAILKGQFKVNTVGELQDPKQLEALIEACKSASPPAGDDEDMFK